MASWKGTRAESLSAGPADPTGARQALSRAGGALFKSHGAGTQLRHRAHTVQTPHLH